MGSKSSDMYPEIHRKDRHRREGNVKTRQSQSVTTEARKYKEQNPPLRVSAGTCGPADNSISDFWPPELQVIK